MNRKLFHVIRREYLQQIKTKGFWIGTILIPALGLAFVVLAVNLLGDVLRDMLDPSLASTGVGRA